MSRVGGPRVTRAGGAPRYRPALLAVLALLAAACSPADEDSKETWRVSPEPELAIGQITGDDAYLFDTVESARFLPEGRILVADQGKSVLRIYGPEGGFRKEFGSPGEGPGEFLRIDGTWLLPGGRISVWDPKNRRITTFGPEGELVATNRVVGGQDRSGTFGNLQVFLGAYVNGDAVLAALHSGTEIGGTEVRPDPWVAGRFDPSGEIVATVRMPDTVIPLEIEGDRLLGRSVSELDVERVVVHGIER